MSQSQTYEPIFLVCDIGGQGNDTRLLYFSQPVAFPTLITELHANWFDILVPVSTQVLISDTSYAPSWTDDSLPVRAVFTESSKAIGAVALPVPYLLKAGHSLQIEIYNGYALGFQVMTAVTAKGARIVQGGLDAGTATR